MVLNFMNKSVRLQDKILSCHKGVYAFRQGKIIFCDAVCIVRIEFDHNGVVDVGPVWMVIQ